MMRRSLRFRATAVTVIVVGVALVVGSIGLVLLVRSSITGNVREAAELRAEDVAATLREGSIDDVDLAVEDPEDTLIEILDDHGAVVASSESGLLDTATVSVSVRVDSPEGPLTVRVTRILDDVAETTWAVVRVLLIGVPLLLVLVGVVAWRLVGRSLAPVDEMRRTVDAITAEDPDRRVPEPEDADEIARLATTMNGMLDRLAAGRDRMAGFVADAAHELRSPVAAMRQHAEVALARPQQADVVELAGVVRDENLRLQRLVDDLLLLARADERALADVRRPVDLDDLVLAEVERVRSASDTTIDVSRVSGGQVTGDAVQLGRLVGNLVENAARHADGRVEVSVSEDGDGVTLVVDDDGPGIPAGQRGRVFERFVRLDEARSRDDGGSGLGLAIVDAVARSHGAEVEVGTSPADGARFTVRFPAR